MDIVFKCQFCKVELEVESGASGQQIDCPSCGKPITIPQPDPTNLRVGAPPNIAKSEHKTLSVPISDRPVQPLITKSLPPLEIAARDGARQLTIKTFRHSDCREVGHDNFDKITTEFLRKIGEENVVNINTFTYTYVDIGTQKLITDFGLLVVYKS